jgi:hypothetical protein
VKGRDFALAGLLAMALPNPATAGVFADDLGRCAINATSAADRQVLVRWMFMVAAENPALVDLTAISDAERQQGFRAAAALYDRLLLHDCRRETVQVLRNEGADGLGAGFQVLGQLAGREMMNSPQSAASLRDFFTGMDRAGMDEVMREAGLPVRPGRVPR